MNEEPKKKVTGAKKTNSAKKTTTTKKVTPAKKTTAAKKTTPAKKTTAAKKTTPVVKPEVAAPIKAEETKKSPTKKLVKKTNSKKPTTTKPKSVVTKTEEVKITPTSVETKKEETIVTPKEEIKSVEETKTFALKSDNASLKTLQLSKLLLILAAAAVVFFLIAQMLNNKSYDKTPSFPIVFTNADDALLYVNADSNEVTKIKDDVYSASVTYPNKDTRYLVYDISDGTFLFDTKTGKDIEKIGDNVDEVVFSSDDKRVLYINDDTLIVHDMKDKFTIDTEVDGIVGATNKYVIYSKDGNLYSRNFTKEKGDTEKIAGNVTTGVINKAGTKLMYRIYDSTGYDVYVYEISSKKKEKVLTETSTIYDYNDDFSKFIYDKKGETSVTDISSILDDDKVEDDKNFTEIPFGDYIDDKVSYEEYSVNRDEKTAISVRDNIRDYVKKYNSTDSLNIYITKNGKEKEIATNISEVLATDIDNDEVVYTKETFNSDAKIKISEVTSLYNFKDKLKEIISTDLYFQNNTSKPRTIESNIDGSVTANIISNDGVYYVKTVSEKQNLYYAKISGTNVKESKSIAEDVYTKVLDNKTNLGLIYATSYEAGKYNLNVVKNGKTKELVQGISNGYQISDDKNTIYFYTDYDKKIGNFASYSGSKVKTVLEGVNQVVYINDSLMYVTKDLNSSTGNVDLYRYNGSKLTKLASDVSGAAAFN